MYCNKCGNHNPQNSNFCHHCGMELSESTPISDNHYDHDTSNEYIGVEQAPYPYAISTWKLIVLSITTFGMYDVYWFYRQWRSFSTANNLKYNGFIICVYSLFAPITSYSLFKGISNNVKEVNKGRGLEAGGLAVLYFILGRIWLGFLPLIPVQNKINLYWEKKYGDKLVRSNFGVWNWIIVTVSVFIVTSVVLSDISKSNTPATNTGTNQSEMDVFKANYKKSFVESCIKNGGSDSTAYCECAANYMINTYTEVQLTQITQEFETTNQLPQALNDAVSACKSKPKSNQEI